MWVVRRKAERNSKWEQTVVSYGDPLRERCRLLAIGIHVISRGFIGSLFAEIRTAVGITSCLRVCHQFRVRLVAMLRVNLKEVHATDFFGVHGLIYGYVPESVDGTVLGAGARNRVWVQVPPYPPMLQKTRGVQRVSTAPVIGPTV